VLGRTYRFVVLNNMGAAFASGAIVIKARRWNFNSSGVQTWEASEASVLSSTSLTGNAAYNKDCAAVDNSTNAYLGGEFEVKATTPASGTSATGSVTVYIENSTDGGTTWPDDGQGDVVAVISTIANATTYTVVKKL
jgi:hypothetical protein